MAHLAQETTAAVSGMGDDPGATAAVSDGDALTGVTDDPADRTGGVSNLFDITGVGSTFSLAEWDPGEWDRLVGVNPTGGFNGLRCTVPHAAAKAGGHSRHCISGPGARRADAGERGDAVDDPDQDDRPTAGVPSRETERFERTTPVGRLGEPAGVADVVVFLCSGLAPFVTGQMIAADEGMTLHGSAIDGVFEQISPQGTPGAERMTG